VLEVPADEYIDPSYRRQGDVQGIRAHARTNGSLLQALEES
jgi:hypothetical protein